MVVVTALSRTIPPTGPALVLFFALTFLLSIALGWHYALDGLVGAGLVLIAFKLLAPFAKKDAASAKQAH